MSSTSKTNIISSKDVLKILQFSDTHLAADAAKTCYGLNTNESLTRVIQYAIDHYPQTELAIVTGDLTHDETAAGYERLKMQFELLELPVYCLAGNHDIPELMHSVLLNGNVQTQRSTLKKTWQLILLDSTVPGKVGGHLDQQELAWLEYCLESQPEYYSLICLHHPPFLTGSHWLDNGLILDNPDDLFAVLDRHEQVRGVLWGHMHQEFYIKRKNVDYFATPSTMTQFKPHSRDFTLDNTPPGFRWLDLHANGRIETGVVYL